MSTSAAFSRGGKRKTFLMSREEKRKAVFLYKKEKKKHGAGDCLLLGKEKKGVSIVTPL